MVSEVISWKPCYPHKRTHEHGGFPRYRNVGLFDLSHQCARIGEPPHAERASDLLYYSVAMLFIDTRQIAKRTQWNAAEVDSRRRNFEE